MIRDGGTEIYNQKERQTNAVEKDNKRGISGETKDVS